MKNSNMPVTAHMYMVDADVIAQQKASGGKVQTTIQYKGLTKREHFAGLAMQSLLVNVGRNGFEADYKLATTSLKLADLLLADLLLEDATNS